MNLTKRQAEICRCIIRKKRLNTVLRECDIADYLQLQELIPTKYLIFLTGTLMKQRQLSLNLNFSPPMRPDASCTGKRFWLKFFHDSARYFPYKLVNRYMRTIAAAIATTSATWLRINDGSHSRCVKAYL